MEYVRLASEVKRLHVSLIRGRSRVRAIDRILFELVERGFKAVYVIKKIVLRPIKFH